MNAGGALRLVDGLAATRECFTERGEENVVGSFSSPLANWRVKIMSNEFHPNPLSKEALEQLLNEARQRGNGRNYNLISALEELQLRRKNDHPLRVTRQDHHPL